MKPINIGRLNKRITLLELQPGTDELGQDKLERKEVAMVWATVRPQRGTEAYNANKLWPEQFYTITIRYRPGITSDMLIRYHNKVFDIKSVVNVEEASYMLEMECTEYIEKRSESYDDV